MVKIGLSGGRREVVLQTRNPNCHEACWTPPSCQSGQRAGPPATASRSPIRTGPGQAGEAGGPRRYRAFDKLSYGAAQRQILGTWGRSKGMGGMVAGWTTTSRRPLEQARTSSSYFWDVILVFCNANPMP